MIFTTPTQQSSPLTLESWEGAMSPNPDNDAYHALPSYFSSSDIKVMEEGPESFFAKVINKASFPKKESKAMNLGSCAHDCFLEQTTDRFVVMPEHDARTKAGKEIRDNFLKQYHDKCIVSVDQYDTLMWMFDVISSNDLASSYLGKDSLIEQSNLYLDEATKLRCKIRPDIFNPKEGYIVDYKTINELTDYQFEKQAARLKYPLSAAHYIAGIERLYNIQVKQYLFIVQQTTAPYHVRVYRLSERDRKLAFEQRANYMGRIAYHLESNEWDQMSRHVRELNVAMYGLNPAEE